MRRASQPSGRKSLSLERRARTLFQYPSMPSKKWIVLPPPLPQFEEAATSVGEIEAT